VKWPSRVEELPELLRDFLIKHRRVDWLPLIVNEEEDVLPRALAGMVKKGDGEVALLSGLMSLEMEVGNMECVLRLEEGADLGNSEAQFLLAELILVQGAEGVEKKKVMKHLEMAAASKVTGARVLLAVIHQ